MASSAGILRRGCRLPIAPALPLAPGSADLGPEMPRAQPRHTQALTVASHSWEGNSPAIHLPVSRQGFPSIPHVSCRGDKWSPNAEAEA